MDVKETSQTLFWFLHCNNRFREANSHGIVFLSLHFAEHVLLQFFRICHGLTIIIAPAFIPCITVYHHLSLCLLFLSVLQQHLEYLLKMQILGCYPEATDLNL